MANYFIDTSALMKRYVSERGSSWMRQLCRRSSDNILFIAAITQVELIASVTRRARSAPGAGALADLICASFASHLLYSYEQVQITAAVVQTASNLARSHALRGYDAIQLACAMVINLECVAEKLPAVIWVCSDVEINAAAQREGLVVIDPVLM